MGRRVARKKGEFLRIRKAVAKLDLPLHKIVAVIRLIDDYMYLYNLESISQCKEGSVDYNIVKQDIVNYENFIKAREVINEVKYNNSSTGELRSGKEAITTFREYGSAE